MGSSPLTRGKPVNEVTERLGLGLIPAHAGKTLFDVSTGKQRRAHPRSRGENGYYGSGSEGFSGSSPLTRGKQCLAVSSCYSVGLIPAHAGKTTPVLAVMVVGPAHPRSRGENGFRETLLDHLQGSSPLTRGKPDMSPDERISWRLIPAHAGKT